MHRAIDPRPPLRRARGLLIGATLLWGASFALLRALELAQTARLPTLSPILQGCGDMAARFGLAALVLLPFQVRHLGGITPREWSQAGGLAAFAGIGLCLQTIGLAQTDASIAAFLTQLYLPVIPFIVAVRDRRWPRPRIYGACALVLAGAALLSPGVLAHFIPGPGEGMILLSTGFLAAQIVWVERPLYATNRAGLVTFLMFAMMAAFFALVFAAGGGSGRVVRGMFGDGALLSLLVALVLFCTVVGFFVMNRWQRWVSATEAGLIYCLEPVIASVLACFLPGWLSRWCGIGYPNETPGWHLVAGGALILIAMVWIITAGDGAGPARSDPQ
jgi:drug/metabolite transporter (DMT)-like permease